MPQNITKKISDLLKSEIFFKKALKKALLFYNFY